MDKTLAELIRISQLTGRDASLVQGGGGNTSLKTFDGKFMYIKASGFSLKDMNLRQGWCKLDLNAVREIIADKKLSRLDVDTREAQIARRLLRAGIADTSVQVSPSIETPLHALLDRCVIHLHPVAVSAYVNAKNGQAEVAKLFQKEKYPPMWVSYTDSGYMLARKIARLAAEYEKQFGRTPQVIFLEKHGLLVTAPTAESALKLVRQVVRICKSKLTPARKIKIKPIAREKINTCRLAVRKAYFEATGDYVPVKYITNDAVRNFLARRDGRTLLAAGPLSAGELAYADGPPLWVEKCDGEAIGRKLKTQAQKSGKAPSAFLVNQVGLFIAGVPNRMKTLTEVATGSLMIRGWAAKMGGINALTKRQVQFVNRWETQTYQQQATEKAQRGDLQNRIAVVTGAGSGLGRSISIGLARAGAMVAAADIDAKALQETISLIRKELPQAAATALSCDVTDEKSVTRAFDALMAEWGGLDILVNAAGVAPAYPLVDLPVEKLRLALEVNLTGYFLMAQAAARIMVKQDIGGNIINLSSKSGLEASLNNTPYNATKAGEVHMARGWAMELGEYGIRVNSVCPGNVFEGSKIWNPKYIRECAKKYGIRPEEVIDYYVDKTILKREIKGQDIAEAVVFLCSDKARTITGQIIVADSGQVMVR